MGYESLARLFALADDVTFPLHLDHLDGGPPLNALAQLLRRAPEILANMTVHRFAANLVLRPCHAIPAHSCDPKTRQRFFLSSPMRICARCLLADPPYECLVWSFRPLPICVKHGLFLLTHCPACHQPLRAFQLDPFNCDCGNSLSTVNATPASPEVIAIGRLAQRLLNSAPIEGTPSVAAHFAWADRLRSAVFRSAVWLLRTRHEMDLPASLADESVAWLAAIRLIQDEHAPLCDFLETYQAVAKHRGTSTGINRAFGFLLRDAARLERYGYHRPAEQLREYLLETYSHGHLSRKTTLFRRSAEQHQLRTRAWLTQTEAARALGVGSLTIKRLVAERALRGRVVAAGDRGRTVGLISRESLTRFARQLSTHSTLEEVATRVGVSRHRVSELIAEKLLPGSVRIARRWQIPAEAVEDLLARVDKLPVASGNPAGWLSLREATRKFGPHGLKLAQLARMTLDGTISARRLSSSRYFSSVIVSSIEMENAARATSEEWTTRRGWSLHKLAREIFPQRRFKVAVICKWIQAGLLQATRKTDRWHIEHAAVVRFRTDFCLAPEACQALKISRSTLARWESQGQITAAYGRRSHPAAGASLYRRTDLIRLIELSVA